MKPLNFRHLTLCSRRNITNQTKLFCVVILVDDEDLDEDGEGSDAYDDCDFDRRSRVCHTGAVDNSNGDPNVDQDADAAKVESDFFKQIFMLSYKTITCERQSLMYFYCRSSTLLAFLQFRRRGGVCSRFVWTSFTRFSVYRAC